MHVSEHSSANLCVTCGSWLDQRSAGGLCVRCIGTELEARTTRAAKAPQNDALPPDYEWIDLLGNGGMGVVHLGFQRSLQRYVALKHLAHAFRGEQRARDRFMHEARAAARLSHPGIVPILEVGLHHDLAWYTMEYVEGGDLAQLLQKRGGALPWEDAVKLILPVVEAIESAHASGVAHRDLKPSNILIGRDGSPKVADFGVAWIVGQEIQNLTATGEIIGTPAYLPPEALSGQKHAHDARIGDIYSLGALLFHLIVGRTPFAGEHPLQLFSEIANADAPKLSACAHSPVPWRLSDVCERCLRKSPDQRFQTAQELAAALRHVLERPTTRRPLASNIQRINRRTLFILAAPLIIMTSGTLAYHYWPVQTRAAAALQNNIISLAVIPPQVVNGDEELNFVASGLQEELVASLNRITQLRVVTATSAKAAAERTNDPRFFRELLGVEAVLQVKVRKWQDMLRVSAQLISTSDAAILWTATYDRRETNLFNLETDLATDLAVEVRAKLSSAPHDAQLGTSSTIPAAQKALLKAQRLTADASASVEQLNEAEALLLQATSLDPNFALAFARLSSLETLIYHWGNDRSESRLDRALKAAQSALKINPALLEAKLALGSYYLRGSKDYAMARRYFRNVLDHSEANGAALEGMAQVERRAGNFEASEAFYKSAAAIDPLNANLAYNAIDTAFRLRRYEQADELLTEALRRMPKHVALMKLRGDLYVAWKGDLRPMEEDITSRNSQLPTPDLFTRDKITWLLLSGKSSEAVRTLQDSSFDILSGQAIYQIREGYLAQLLYINGDYELAKRTSEAAEARIAATLQRMPNDPRVLMHAAEIYAIQGKRELAEQLGRRTLTPGDLACVDAFDRGFYRRMYAVVLTIVGLDRDAQEQLRLMLKEPNQSSLAYIKLHPVLRRQVSAL